MEERINQAIEFKDQNGFRRSLLQYVRHLSTHALESRLKEVFSKFIFSKIFDLRCLQDQFFKKLPPKALFCRIICQCLIRIEIWIGLKIFNMKDVEIEVVEKLTSSAWFGHLIYQLLAKFEIWPHMPRMTLGHFLKLKKYVHYK